MNVLNRLANNAATNGNPIDVLRHFLDNEQKQEAARNLDQMRFVGYVIELGYDTAKIITNDPYKVAVGGIPRGSFLIMTPAKEDKAPPHFTLLRVNGVSPTPLSSQVQQTYFELQKKSMPELDVWTQSELQWGALDCDVLGMFYADPQQMSELRFSGDVNNVVSAHRYKVFSPNDELLKLIVNGMVKKEQQAEIGILRTMECGLFSNGAVTNIPVKISMKDFKGCRTAMFGKTRLGKSNVVKLLATAMLDATANEQAVGQLIFDVNGEYANDNHQNLSVKTAYPERCEVYALTKRPGTESRQMRLNFYEQTESTIDILGEFLAANNRNSIYMSGFASVKLPSIEEVLSLPQNEQTRPVRKILFLWAILKKAGFSVNERKLRDLGVKVPRSGFFDPGFSDKLRQVIYPDSKVDASTGKAILPPTPNSLDTLVRELELVANYKRENSQDKIFTELSKSSGKPLFDAEDSVLLDFLSPASGRAGPSVLMAFTDFHSHDAGDFINEINELLDKGKTVILDLGSASDKIRKYFSDMLSKAVFAKQEEKFVNNALGNKFVQLYFEEAHNLFPPDGKDLTGVYARFAKEGAKFHIGMVYSTQSPSTINKELLAQTENFFIGHLSSQDEAKSLARVQVAFAGVQADILRAKTPGYMRMLTMSHRFVVPLQANLFEDRVKGLTPVVLPPLPAIPAAI
jgi:hypothetical protein